MLRNLHPSGSLLAKKSCYGLNICVTLCHNSYIGNLRPNLRRLAHEGRALVNGIRAPVAPRELPPHLPPSEVTARRRSLQASRLSPDICQHLELGLASLQAEKSVLFITPSASGTFATAARAD